MVGTPVANTDQLGTRDPEKKPVGLTPGFVGISPREVQMSAPSFAPMVLSPHSLVDSSQRNRKPRHFEPPVQGLARIREIVACLDGSDLGRGVVPHARLVSDALGARLTLLHVLEADEGSPLSSVPADPLDWGLRQREARAHLQDVASELAPLGSEVRSELIQGRAAEQICNWAIQHEVDLTVLCSHGSRGHTEWELASTARKLIERISGSLLLVPAEAAARSNTVRYERILVPLDGSLRAESVLPIAMRIAVAQASEVVLVHIVPRPEIIRPGLLDAEGRDLERRVMDHNHRAATDYLERLSARVRRPEVRLRSVVVANGSARTQLDQVIRKERADLVVMSAHGNTGRLDSPCGSVTEYTLTHASVPLLVMRERDRRNLRRVERASSRRIEPRESPDPLAS